jgi:hypothetical protein
MTRTASADRLAASASVESVPRTGGQSTRWLTCVVLTERRDSRGRTSGKARTRSQACSRRGALHASASSSTPLQGGDAVGSRRAPACRRVHSRHGGRLNAVFAGGVLEDFAERGLVAKVPGGRVATDKGLRPFGGVERGGGVGGVIQLLVARQCVEVDLLTGSQTARDQVPGLHARRSDLSEQLKIGRLAGRAPRVLRVDASHENGRSLPGFFHAGHDTVPTRASAKQRRCAYLAPPGNEAGAVFRRSAATGPARRAASDLAAGAAQAEGLGAPAQAGAAFLCGTWSAVALLGCAETAVRG